MASLFSTTSQIAAINTRARSGIITLPLTSASLYRQIMIKDLYGAFPLSTLTLSTQLGDAFEDGTTSRILSNAYEFQALYAGSTSRWHTVGGTQFTAAYISSLRVDSLQLGSGDGWADFGPLRATAISSLLVQTGLIQTAAMSTFAISTGTLTARNISVATLSTTYGFFSTISSGRIFAQFVGDGSGLTGLPASGLSIIPPVLSTTTLSTGFLSASNISTNSLSTNQLNSGSISNSGVISTVGLNVGALSSINISTLSLAAGNISTLTLGAATAYITNLFVGTEDFGSSLTAASNITQTGGTTTLAGLSVNTISTNQLNSGSISNSGVISTQGLNVGALSSINISTLSLAAGNISTLSLGATTAYITNLFVGTEDFGSALTATSNITQTSGTTTLAGLSVNTISTNQLNSGSISNSGVISTQGLNVGALSSINISTLSLAAGSISTLTLGAASAYITNLFVGTEDFGSALTASSNITQTGGTTVLAGLSVNTISTNFIVARNISATTMSTNFGFFSTISSGSFYGKFIGDGSALTGLPAAGVGVTSTLSTLVFLTSSISSSYINSQQAYISSLTVDYLAIGSNFGYVNMGDVIATSLSSIAIESQTLTTSNLKVGTVSSISFVSFPGLRQGYAQSVLAEQSTGTGLQELLVFRGSSASDRIRMQTTGSIVFEPGVSARVYPAVPSNVTPAMIINTSSNVGIGIAAPTTTLDVAGTGRFQILSTQQLFVSTISSGTIYGRYIGDGSLLTGLPASGLSIVPPVLSTTTLSTGLLTASNISTNSISTNNLTVSNLYGTGIAVLPGLSVNTISTNQVNSANISTVTFGASTAYITNLFVGTEDFGSVLTANSNIRQTAGTTTLAGLSVNTISTNTILANNISTASLAAYEGFFSTLGSELSYSQEAYFSTINTENLIVQHAFMSSLIVNSIQIGETTGFITMGDVLTNSISTNTLNTSNISNAGNFSNSGSATFFSNGTSAASPSTTNTYPYASFKINSASTNTLTPVTPLLLMIGNYGGSIAGGLTQGVGPVLTLGTIPDVGATQEGYRLTGSNSAFYGNVDMQGNNISNINVTRITAVSTNTISTNNLYVSQIYGADSGVVAVNSAVYYQGNGIDMGGGNINQVGTYYNNTADINVSAVAGYSINQTGSNINLNASTINLRGTSNSAVRVGPRQLQGTAADTTTYGLERSRHEIQFAGYRDAQIDKIGSKIVNINKQTYGNTGLRHLIQSADLAFFTVPPDTADIDNTVERMRITDGGNVGIGTTAPSVSLDVIGTGRFTAVSTNIISTGTVYGTFIGNGSGLTGLTAAGTNNLSTLAFYTSSISSATIQTSNIRIGTISSQSFLAYPGLQQGYAQSIIAEQSTGTGLQELLIFRGSSASDRIRLQTTGFICFETGVGARTFPSVGSNATPSWMIDVNGCVGVGLIPSGTASKLDVAGQGRFQNLSTTSIQAGSINLSVAFV